MRKIIGVLALSCVLFDASAEESSNLYNWTGAYAGVNLGSVWTGSEFSANQANFLPTSRTYNQTINNVSVNPGLQVGYLRQFCGGWVTGVEGDFTYPAANGQLIHFSGGGSAYDKFNVHNNLQGSLRLRLGYAVDRFLPFVTAGVSFGGMAINYTDEVRDNYAKNTTQTGWVLGGGLEYGFFDNFSGRLEYLYTDYGNALKMQLPTVAGVIDRNGFTSASINSNVLRAAVNYRF